MLTFFTIYGTESNNRLCLKVRGSSMITKGFLKREIALIHDIMHTPTMEELELLKQKLIQPIDGIYISFRIGLNGVYIVMEDATTHICKEEFIPSEVYKIEQIIAQANLLLK